MRPAVIALLSFGLLASGAASEEDGDHLASTHVEHGTEGHHHGDADDHHDSPGSPCHHHEDHICSGSGPDVAVAPPALLAESSSDQSVAVPTFKPALRPSLQLIFHIPI